jgi:hypothetical protein
VGAHLVVVGVQGFIMKTMLLAVLAGSLAFTSSAWAQYGRKPKPPATPPVAAPGEPEKPLVERLLPRGKTKEWTLTVEIRYPGEHLDSAYFSRRNMYRPDLLYANNQQILPTTLQNRLDNITFDFKAAQIVFPVPASTAGHEMQEGTFSSNLYIDSSQTAAAVKPAITEGYHSGTRLAKWDLGPMEAKELRLQIMIPVICWETTFDEEVAQTVDWPKGEWPAIAKSTFEPLYLVDFRENRKEIAENQKLLADLLKKWLHGRDPRKTMKPIELARELAGDVMEFVQPIHPGTVGEAGSTFYGYDLMTSGEIIREQRGAEDDMHVLLLAVYRAAGLPARMVFGYDMSDDPNKNPKAKRFKNPSLRTWVEFAVVDPKTNGEVWIPVDLLRQRRTSSRPPAEGQPWKYFGNNQDLTYVIPIAFQAHPPANYSTRGYPAFWGWNVVPETPPLRHALRFSAMHQNSAEKDENNPTK